MKNKSVKLCPETNILDSFYKAVVSDNLRNLHLYHSDVHYIRAALQERTGKTFKLSEIEDALEELASDNTEKAK
jgi:hypothetical protein